MQNVDVCETFVSIQGESTRAGMSCFFVRLSGCNLRCAYCDTQYAYKPGRETAIATIVSDCAASSARIVEITGGEPMLQPGFHELARALRDDSGKQVLVETNGSRDISVIPEGVIAVMDVKCPGSGECGATDLSNIKRLRPRDEVKFVLTDRADYEWAREFVSRHDLASRCGAILFGPAHGRLAPEQLARWLIADGLPVRLQIQLHKVLGFR